MNVSERVRTGRLKPNLSFDCAVCGTHVVMYAAPSQQAREPLKYCSRACKGKALSGEKHPLYVDGRSKDPDHVRALKRASYARNGEHARAAAIAYRRAHPESDLAKTKRRNALKRGAGIATLTRSQWDALKVLYGHRCVYCGTRSMRLTQDHVIPLSKGGQHAMDNVVPACISCNSSKHDGAPKKPVQFALAIV